MKISNLRPTTSALINLTGGIVVVYLLIVLGQTVKHNYDLGRQIEDLHHQAMLIQDQKDALAFSLQYYKTDSFHEREAHAKLGLQYPSENVVIIPGGAPAPTPRPVTAAASVKNMSHLQQWLTFLGGSSNE